MAESIDIITELKVPETFDLGSFINSKVQFPSKDVKVSLDMEGSMKAWELAEDIADLKIKKEQIEEEAKGGITGGDTEAVEAEMRTKHSELTVLVDQLEAEKLTFTLRGAQPKVWRVMHKIARRDFPIPKSIAGNEDAVWEATNLQNEFVGIETVRLATESITAPNGEVTHGKDIKHELIRGLYDVLEEKEWEQLKTAAETITFQVGAFDKIVSSDADFLPTSSASDTTETI